MLLASFCIFLTMFLTVGLLSYRKSAGTEADYFMAGQNTSPHFLALSACASKYSGYMFIGFMGYAFSSGVESMWMLGGIIVGDLCVYYPVARRLRENNEHAWALSYNEVLTFWRAEDYIWLRRLAGALTLFFLFVYASAQLKAGSKALHAVLEFPPAVGVVLSAVLVMLYCWAGGIRASIWTDALQLSVMFFALLTILWATVAESGGFAGFWSAVERVDTPGYADWFSAHLSVGGATGLALFFIGWVFGGMCVLGQPHVMVRAMALPKIEDIGRMFRTYVALDLVLGPLFFLTGLCARLQLGTPEGFDVELALPLTSLQVLAPAFAGLTLAGVFASSMSTADSQILSCSSAITRDFTRFPKNNLTLSKIATVTVTLCAMVIALFAPQNVFDLVIFAWTGLGCSLGPVMVLKLFKFHLPQWGAITTCLTGGGTSIAWQLAGHSGIVESALPGIAAAFTTALLTRGIYELTQRNGESAA